MTRKHKTKKKKHVSIQVVPIADTVQESKQAELQSDDTRVNSSIDEREEDHTREERVMSFFNFEDTTCIDIHEDESNPKGQKEFTMLTSNNSILKIVEHAAEDQEPANDQPKLANDKSATITQEEQTHVPVILNKTDQVTELLAQLDTAMSQNNEELQDSLENTGKIEQPKPRMNEYKRSSAYLSGSVHVIPRSKIYPPGEGPCRKCHGEIRGKKVFSRDFTEELSGQWHRDCFRCIKCDLKFSKSVPCYILNDNPYCQIHYHEENKSICQICKEFIEGECLQNGKLEKFHVGCLKFNA